MSKFQDAVGTRFRRIITSSPDGTPAWVEYVRQGDDAGLYKPTDAPWLVHASLTTLIGGIRALLMQALHPGSLAGVSQHSRYEDDPLGRLAGTTQWLTIMTFASKQAIARESARVNDMHARVRGSYTDNSGQQRNYQATDTDLLLWVHIAFTDSFLATYELYSGSHIDRDEYIRLWSQAVVPLGLDNAPQSSQDLAQNIDRYDSSGQLQVNDVTLRVVEFIKHPPLSRTARFAYWFLFQAAVASIPKTFRRRLGLRALPLWLVSPVTMGFLKLMHALIGNRSPLEEAALERLARIAAR
ncbi:MAG: DUF2236 domain-containing protein [Actinobacteria bacterium]|uniref:Unannotated protein n=1 Tax=freshwater metagenome TaxID=449393 RepID=A0A6J5Z2Y1_9ZZZZ|nr:DUF2236 domain-containing protein [Actinomycetota bacterium]